MSSLFLAHLLEIWPLLSQLPRESLTKWKNVTVKAIDHANIMHRTWEQSLKSLGELGTGVWDLLYTDFLYFPWLSLEYFSISTVAETALFP
jgi:hypothetical protein